MALYVFLAFIAGLVAGALAGGGYVQRTAYNEGVVDMERMYEKAAIKPQEYSMSPEQPKIQIPEELLMGYGVPDLESLPKNVRDMLGLVNNEGGDMDNE